jgi:hypothetical protein
MPIVLTSPANGQVLKYNGTSWVNDSDAGITGSGATGQVAYFTGATTQAGNNALFWDTTNLRLGIGTTSPSGKLQVKGALHIERSVVADFSIIDNEGNLNLKAATGGGGGNFNIVLHTAGSERVRLFGATGNFGINTGATDSGQKLQVIGTSYFSDTLRVDGNVGIGGSASTARLINVSKNITGASTSYGQIITGNVLSDVTGGARVYYSEVGTAAASFTLPELTHYYAVQGTFGAGSAVTNQYGFRVFSNLTGASNDYGFYGDLAAGTGIWNLYMNGTANNYMAGSLGIGSTSIQDKLDVNGAIRFRLNTSNFTSIGDSGVLDFVPTSVFPTTPCIRLAAVGSSTVGGEIRFLTGTSISMFERMRLDASGNLGIGTASPLYKLQVGNLENTSGTTNDIFITGDKVNANGYYARLIFGNSTQSGGSTASIRGERSNGSNFATSLTFYTNEVGSGGNGVENMRLDANGNLLLGNTTGTSRLDVAKSASDTLSRANSAMAIGDFVFGAGLMLQQRVSAPYGFMVQATNSTAATFYPLLLQPNGGNVVLGGTTDSGEKLQVTGTAKITGATTIATNLVVNGTSIEQNNASGLTLNASNASGAILFRTAGSERMSIAANGNLAVDSNVLFVDAVNNEVGIGTNAPNSSLHVVGSITKSISDVKTANYTATATDHTILCSAAGGGFTITLPAASGITGRIYVIKKTNASSGVNSVTVDGNGAETIDGSATINLSCRSSVTLQCDGSNWHILSLYTDTSCI